MPDNAPDASIEEIDARIDEQLTIIAQIDAQLSDRSNNVATGDLERADFVGWAVRALERRQYAVSDLVTLRHRRHAITKAEARVRVDAAQTADVIRNLRSENAALLAERVDAAVQLERANVVITNLKRENASLRATPRGTATDTPETTNQTVARLDAVHSERLRKLKEAAWLALLEGEVAVLHRESVAGFLHRVRASVPTDFRNEFCARQTDVGYPRPRTSAEIAAEKAK